MELLVEKRDGRLVPYEQCKVISAVNRACYEVDTNMDIGSLIENVVHSRIRLEYIKSNESPVSVECIQDIVEEELMNSHPKVARVYIRYRYDREKVRSIKPKSLVNSYVDNLDWRVKENASVSYSLGGMILNNSGAVTANYWLNEVYTPDIADAHKSAQFHIHDLSMLSTYCVGHNLLDLIKRGLSGVHGKITSAPAKHLSTLCNQMVNFLGCFTDDMHILLSDGTSMSIRDMLDSGKSNWNVKSFDPDTGNIVDAELDNLHKTRTVDEYIELTLEDGSVIKCTKDHNFYTTNRGWVEAEDLCEDDDLIIASTKRLFVYKTTNIVTGEFYIGAHITYNEHDDYLGSGARLLDNISKYGVDKFNREILAYASNSNELHILEHEYINMHKYNSLCLNVSTGVNYGFSSINGASFSGEFLKENIANVCVYKDGVAININYERLNEFLSIGYKLVDRSLIWNDGSKNYLYHDQLDISKLFKGILNPNSSYGMINKCHTESSKKLIRDSLAINSESRGKSISKSLNRDMGDGNSFMKHLMNTYDENGLKPADKSIMTQIKNNSNQFINKDTNPNYKILDDGHSIPWHTNMNRIANGTHNLVNYINMGCHNKSLGVRIRYIKEFYNDLDTWDISYQSYLEFIDKYPDWTGKFNYEGFKYSVHYCIKKYNLKVEVANEDI